MVKYDCVSAQFFFFSLYSNCHVFQFSPRVENTLVTSRNEDNFTIIFSYAVQFIIDTLRYYVINNSDLEA